MVLALFGGALLLWCAAEVRLRHRLRRRGVPAASVRIAYDPRRPNRVVLAAAETSRVALTDLLWAALGTGCLVAGAVLPAVVATR
ncbi:hypothetical protein [Kitasatospora sp. A2-31]|uniref:hypothetical protein n=1 Tax=Kitasatospora sp. A2-31 TaxID=2916414 RepID=UPI001EEE646A|nr:hypothetical protein [Kitasatospora sp. A2-31]MCG6499165.1 hypothetical protein [Kitasatospora sp. A2-31]